MVVFAGLLEILVGQPRIFQRGGIVVLRFVDFADALVEQPQQIGVAEPPPLVLDAQEVDQRPRILAAVVQNLAVIVFR